MKKAVFFDRDGTLIVDKIYLNDPAQIEYLPYVVEALTDLRDAGYVFFVATNQSGVPRGLVQIENLHKIHASIASYLADHKLEILEYYYAPYMTDSDHYYRKPKAGMLMEGVNNYDIDAKNSWMIGDKMTDVEAGHQAGMRSILMGGTDKPEDFDYAPPEAFLQNLQEVSDFILKNKNA
ncbi:HAD family hydrolase [bacterium]|nr:HAD family hydrolase [bacterium]